MTYEEYTRLYETQGRACAICGRHRELGGVDGLYVDHNHKSGKIRGLLCPACNSAIGMFNEDVGLMQRAADYLLSQNTI